MAPEPPTEAALHSHLEPDERLEWSFLARDDSGASDPVLPSGRSVYRLGRTPSAHVFLGPAGEFRRLPDRKVRSAGVASTGRPRSWTVAGVVLGLCLLLVGTMFEYTAPGWSYLFRLFGWATILCVGVTLAHRRWLPRSVYRVETDAKERLELLVPSEAGRYLDRSGSENDEGTRSSRAGNSGFEDRARQELLVGSEASAAVLGIGIGTVVVTLWWGLLLWHHPFVVGLGEWNLPGIGLFLAGPGAAAVTIRIDGGLVSSLYAPLAVGFGLRHYSCLAVSQFHPVSVLCFGTGLVEAATVSLVLWGLGLGVAVAVDGVVRSTKLARNRIFSP